MIRRPSRFFLYFFFLFSLFFIKASYGEELYPFDSSRKDAQFKHLLKEIRCVVCQNQDLADSNALIARDMRTKIYHLVQEGQSDQDVLNYLVARYGDFILLNPPVKPLTWILWFGPLSFLFIGLFIFLYSTQRLNKKIKNLSQELSNG